MTNIQSEDDLLAIINTYFSNSHTHIKLGRGDDCAVLDIISPHSYIVTTTDIFKEDSHFRRSYFLPEAIGYKALAVNISDIYAMGAKPIDAQLALSLPKNIERAYLEALFSSMAKLAKEHNISLSGGDISSSENLSLSITLLGILDKDVKLFRKNAKIGDIVYISSPINHIGRARLALELLEKNVKAGQIDEEILKAHFFPQLNPLAASQIAEFAKSHHAYTFSLMDISDGLAQDIPRLVAPYGVDLSFPLEHVNKEIEKYCKEEAINALEFIFKGGEDYILLGTCPSELWQEFSLACPCAERIGTVVQQGISFQQKALQAHGYDHFNI